MSRLARKFARSLHGRFNIKVYLIDERLSSEAANSALQSSLEKGKSPGRLNKAQDEMAAELILNSFYNTKDIDSLETIQ